MENDLGVQRSAASAAKAGEQPKIPYAQYLEQQPKSKQAFHRWMNRFKVASVGLAVGIFVRALIVSINWTQAAPLEIVFWWVCFAAWCQLPVIGFVALDAIVLGALLPFPLFGGEKQRLVVVSGRRDTIEGLGIVLAAVAWAALGLAFFYSVLTFNMELLGVIVGIFGAVVGIVAGVHFLSTLIRDLSRTLAK